MLPSTLNKLAVSDQYECSVTVVLHPEMNEQSRHVQINETVKNLENLKKICFEEEHVDMYTLTSLL